MLNRYWMRICWGSYDSVTRWYNDTPEEWERAVEDFNRENRYWETTGIAFFDQKENVYIRRWGNA